MSGKWLEQWENIVFCLIVEVEEITKWRAIINVAGTMFANLKRLQNEEPILR